jgi:hypothetical protein
MLRLLTCSLLALVLSAAPLCAAEISGKYVEARTCDVWTGPCFANADFNLTGKNALMAWQIDRGSMDSVNLDGLGVVAVVLASDTLGMEQTGPARAILLVDSRANESQREALVRLACKQGGKLLQNVVAVRSAPISLTMCACKGEVCADLNAGQARIKTRCLDAHHDKVCGNESAYHPPLAGGVTVRPAAADHVFSGTGLGNTWQDFDRRGAYVGSFVAH